MTEKEMMLSEQLYIAADEELARENKEAQKLTRIYNNTTEEEREYRQELLKQLLGKVGENATVIPTFHCDYGKNIYIGDNFFANYDCIIIDVCDVKIGDNVFFAPRVGVYSAGHPIDAKIRNTQLEYGKKINIGNNVWVGANVVINPGVTIGNDVVIGSGSVVTKDIPSHVVAAGNPCRVIRKITKDDSDYWKKQVEVYNKNIK